MSVLTARTARSQIERAIRNALSLATQVRQPAVADVAALRAVAAESTPEQSLRYVTSAGVVYRWERFDTQADNGTSVIKPTNVLTSKPGRWLRTKSNVQTGYAKDVILYNGESNPEDVLSKLLGRKPSFLIYWTGSQHRKIKTDALYTYTTSWDIWAISGNHRPRFEALEGSSVPAEAALDPGVIAMLGDARNAITTFALDLDAIKTVTIGNESPVEMDYAERLFIQKLSFDIEVTLSLPDSPGEIVVSPLTGLDIQYQLTDLPPGTSAGFQDLVTLGYTIPVGVGLTKTPTTGAANVGGTAVASSPAPVTFTANRDTYRDLLTNGTFVYSAVTNNAAPPAVTAGALRVGVTVTDGTGVIWDRILCLSKVDYGDPDQVPQNPVAAVAVSPSSASQAAGTAIQFSSRATHTDGTQAEVTFSSTWESSDPTIALPAPNGAFQLLRAGTATITAKYGPATSAAAIITVT